MGRFLYASMLAIALLPGAPPAHAQTQSPLAEWQYSAGVPLLPWSGDPLPDWSVIVGAGVDYAPRYADGHDQRLTPDPILDLRYRDLAFASVSEGIGVNFVHAKATRAGVAVTYDLGRRRQHEPFALDPIDAAPELKLFVERVIFPVVLRADVRRALGGYDGVVGDLSAYLPLYDSTRSTLLLGPALTIGSARYHQRYFSSRARPGDPALGAGLSAARFGITGYWTLSAHWSIEGNGAAERLLGEPQNAPIVHDPMQYSLSTYLLYEF